MQGTLNFEAHPLESAHLFDTLCTERRLLEGWREVKRNRGSPGIDGETNRNL